MSEIRRSYSVEILDEEFKISEDLIFEKTVKIKFFNSTGGIVSISKYAYVKKELVYDWIKDEKDIQLNNCYISDFSIKEYKTINNIPEIELVILKNFSAKDSFFDCNAAIDFSYAKFTESNINFSSTRFGDGTKSFYKVFFGQGDVNFSNTIWGKGDVDFQMIEVDKGNINFDNAIFSDGDISFVNANFGDGKVSFKNTNFGNGNIDFHYSRFGKGQKSWDKAIFGTGTKDFRKIEFGSGRVDLKRIDFGHGDIDFDETEFSSGKINFKSSRIRSGDISFKMTNFGTDEVNFDNCDFGTGTVSFNDSISKSLSFVGCQLNTFVDFRVNKCHTINLSDTVVRDIIDFIPTDTKVDITTLNLSGMRNLGQILIDWEANNVYNLIAKDTKATNRQISSQFLVLKEAFNAVGQYNDEDTAYVEFKRFELKADIEEALEKNPNNKYWVYPQSFFQNLVFDKMGLYATAPLRVLRSSFIVFSIYSLIYAFLPFLGIGEISCPTEDATFLHQFGDAFYYSAITFLTVGYGDCLPTGIFKWLAPMEGWMGVFLMSYFTVAFVRKILR